MTQRRTWSVAQFKSLKSPTGDSQAGESSHASAPAPPSKPLGRKFLGKFIVYLIFFSILGFFFSSKFPMALGAFLFVTDDEFIAWVLGSSGIRLVPDTLGSNFVKLLAWMIGLTVLLAYWRGSAPTWLSPWLPPSASWPYIAGVVGSVAAAGALIDTASTAVSRKLLPRAGIAPDSLRWTTTAGVIWLVMVGIVIGLVFLLGSASMLPDWFEH
jgi:hypothetical protein